ncbi:MAG: Lin1244/Lin1753 domain-containing protein, partial [Alloprevotella sp.]
MATQLNDTNYFSHDSNARNDEKIIRLRMKHNAAGYGVFFMILERLREEDNYMSAKDYNMIAFDLRVDAAIVKSVVEDFGLFVFTEDGKYFYSDSFKHRMNLKDMLRAKRSFAGKKG